MLSIVEHEKKLSDLLGPESSQVLCGERSGHTHNLKEV